MGDHLAIAVCLGLIDVTDAVESLSRALKAMQSELVAEDLRLALRAIGRLTGRVDIEELLDTVFRDFCIGK